MWRDLVEVDSPVSLHVVLGVDLQLFVGVDGNQYRTDVGLNNDPFRDNSQSFYEEGKVLINSLIVSSSLVLISQFKKNVYTLFNLVDGPM